MQAGTQPRPDITVKPHPDAKHWQYLSPATWVSEGQLLLKSWQTSHAKQGRDYLQWLGEKYSTNKQPVALLRSYQCDFQTLTHEESQAISILITLSDPEVNCTVIGTEG